MKRFEWHQLVQTGRPNDPAFGPAPVMLVYVGAGRIDPIPEVHYIDLGRLGDDDPVYGTAVLDERANGGASMLELAADVTVFLDFIRLAGSDGPLEPVNLLRRRPLAPNSPSLRDILGKGGGWLCWTWQLAALLEGSGISRLDAGELARSWSSGSLKAEGVIRGLQVDGEPLSEALERYGPASRRLYSPRRCQLPFRIEEPNR